MNRRLPTQSKKFLAQSHFPACKKKAPLLQTKMETAMAPFQGGEVVAFTSLFERWFLSTDSQAGDFLPWLIGGSRGPRNCGVGSAQPQDTGIAKILKMERLENVA
jgi:hypothetical protein